jgi:pimeloyl-ACP methyl ester carboxylesterase
MTSSTETAKKGLFRRLAAALSPSGRKTNVYFISGMCYNCSVFDNLRLPKGFRKVYLEWTIPDPDEPLSHYARQMARAIDPQKPFVLVGYSFGAVIMQEMSLFLKPQKSVVISSFKDKSEIPGLFRFVQKTHLAEWVPDEFFEQTEFITEAFNRTLFHATNAEMAQYMTVTDPVYVQWAVAQITGWVPENNSDRLYHIHGTEDQIFPYKQLTNVIPIPEGDHLMVVKMADQVSAVLDSILLLK